MAKRAANTASGEKAPMNAERHDTALVVRPKKTQDINRLHSGKAQSKSHATEPRKTVTGTKRRTKSDPTTQRSQRRQSPIDSAKDFPDTIDVSPKLLKRFYEALLLCHTLGRNRGDHTADEELEEENTPSELEFNKSRRRFLKDLAYLCDYKRGGDTVTAIMLEQIRDDEGVIYWLAVNEFSGPGDCQREFLRNILNSVKGVKSSIENEVENQVFTYAVEFSKLRITGYVKQLKGSLANVLDSLDGAESQDDIDLLHWLRDIESQMLSNEGICRLAFDSRNSPSFNNLLHYATRDPHLAKDFKNIRHIIGRLGHTLRAVRSILAARTRHSKLFKKFKIGRIPSSQSSLPPLQERFQNKTQWESMESMLGRLVTEGGNAPGAPRLKSAFRQLDQDGKLSERLQDQCVSPTWKPRVHGELLLLDYAWTTQLQFVDNDKYISTSKPACYCCSLYIREHPGKFVAPESHNNLWLNWRPPDISAPGEEILIETREKILSKMVDHVRSKLLEQIYQLQVPRINKPDSLTVISSLKPLSRKALLDRPGRGNPEPNRDSDAENSCDPQDGSQIGFSSDDEDDANDRGGGVPL